MHQNKSFVEWFSLLIIVCRGILLEGLEKALFWRSLSTLIRLFGRYKTLLVSLFWTMQTRHHSEEEKPVEIQNVYNRFKSMTEKRYCGISAKRQGTRFYDRIVKEGRLGLRNTLNKTWFFGYSKSFEIFAKAIVISSPPLTESPLSFSGNLFSWKV